ncbi:MAG: NusA-like transcription termination signal-binding factor [Candidatus Aenigmatarchaeota archaeon]
MKKKFDKGTIQAISLFEDKTGVEVIDCVQDEDSAYFLVEPGKAGLAIGKNGDKIKNIGKMLNKRIKVFEYHEENEKELVKNMIMKSKNVNIEGDTAYVEVEKSDRGRVIGSNGSNIKKIRTLLKRNSEIKNLKLK